MVHWRFITLVLSLFIVVVVAPRSLGQPAASMSEAEVAAAIADGTAGRVPDGYIVEGKTLLFRLRVGLLFTPYLRVALAAKAANARYETFDASKVTAELIEPLVYLHVEPASQVSPAAEVPLSDVETVLVMPKGSKDAASAIRPVWMKESTLALQNLFGAKWESKGMVAAFPLEVLNPKYEFVAVYRNEVFKGTGSAKRERRGAPIDKVVR